MSQFSHDEFVKEYIPLLYSEYGEVKAGATLSSQRQEIDILFYPNKPLPSFLGLLGRIVFDCTVLEVYRNPVVGEQIRSCLGKLIELHNSQRGQARLDNSSTKTLAFLWIITPTISKSILKQFGAFSPQGWERGVYFLPPGLNTGIIAIHQLPVTDDTIWLRILGRGKVQLEAIRRLQQFPSSSPYREEVLELVYGLLAKLETRDKSKQDKGEEELIMTLRSLFQEKVTQIRQQGLQEGLQLGRQQGEKQIILRQLARKLGEIPEPLKEKITALQTERLERLAGDLLEFNSLEDLTSWLEKQ
ncbi:MAG: DUF4351 domain-containing protein [Geminocystis sp.]|nr:DUF4351 domain-containing protein [Geminocystis sp.]HIK38608.1 DUF4351 domain-containing protein [Geminocystis sp. M7585_C2015_104]MCS7147671.1 DUF4351 domain-containing protein [Geminocystis sp.]MCX8078486.1 DUF4351 domain-containing protein [Geminocystis sp.]MDW8117225.1 DUF4351 domain-containing protein [Geminocystis sp.]